MKHLPFQSSYRSDFEVVEERHGRVSLYPHTHQLGNLLRALNLELLGQLPERISRPDPRATGLDKIARKSAVTSYCSYANATRPDDLHLLALYDHDLFSRVTIVQMITEHRDRGDFHRFRFYGGDDFFPEIRLSGRRALFSDHALRRFIERVPANPGEELANFLLAFYGTPLVVMTVGPGPALLADYLGSVIAFPFLESEHELFITTCLTIDEIHSLQIEPVPETACLHYGETFAPPAIHNWSPTQWMMKYHRSWERKVTIPPARPHNPRVTWQAIARAGRGLAAKAGHGHASRLEFLDHIPGPCALEIAPGQIAPRINELELWKKIQPDVDWDRYLLERQRERESRRRRGF